MIYHIPNLTSRSSLDDFLRITYDDKDFYSDNFKFYIKMYLSKLNRGETYVNRYPMSYEVANTLIKVIGINYIAESYKSILILSLDISGKVNDNGVPTDYKNRLAWFNANQDIFLDWFDEYNQCLGYTTPVRALRKWAKVSSLYLNRKYKNEKNIDNLLKKLTKDRYNYDDRIKDYIFNHALDVLIVDLLYFVHELKETAQTITYLSNTAS